MRLRPRGGDDRVCKRDWDISLGTFSPVTQGERTLTWECAGDLRVRKPVSF